MKRLPLTSRAARDALRTKLNEARGLPKRPTRIGVYVPVTDVVTTEAIELVDNGEGSFEALIPPEFEEHLSGAERARLRTPPARGSGDELPARVTDAHAPTRR